MKCSDSIVFVVDDDTSVREGLVDLISSVGLKARAFNSAHEFLRHKRSDEASCLVLDVRLPGRSGLDLQRELARSGEPIPIIFITGHGTIPMSVRAMKDGAVEFLTKPFSERELLGAVDQALTRDAAARSKRASQQAIRDRYAALTAREREVFALVVDGRMNKEIAAQ